MAVVSNFDFRIYRGVHIKAGVMWQFFDFGAKF